MLFCFENFAVIPILEEFKVFILWERLKQLFIRTKLAVLAAVVWRAGLALKS